MKCIIITKRHITLCCTLLLALTMCIIGTTTAFAAKDKKLPIYCVQTEKKQIAISFDAAWGNDDTTTLINILSEYNVPATFFVVGTWVDKYPESVKQLSAAGHRIENHSNTHPYMTKLSVAQMKNEIECCNEKIAQITGRQPSLIRVPYGDYDNRVVETVQEMNMYCIQWDVDSLDWKDNATPDSIYQKVTNKVKNGSIVLFHNDAEFTPAALGNILKTLKEDGYEFVFIEDLIYKDNFEIIHDGTQCKISE